MTTDFDVQQVWLEYGQSVRQFLRSRVPDSADADDLAQDILIKTHARLPEIRDPQAFRTWLFRVARNSVADYYRGRHPEQTDADFTSHAAESPEEYERVREHLAGCMQTFIAELPEKYREAVRAVDIEGMPQTELARRLGLSHSAAKSRVQRGRAMLRELYERCCAFEIDARGNLIGYEPRRSSE
jgi:RNA polymerase sigma-70 factor (ECF subfamily)